MSQLSFQYRAINREGGRIRGVIQANDRHDAYRRLVSSGLRPVHLRSGRHGGGGRGRRISLKDISHLSYQFSVLMQARIPLVDGLRSIAEQEPNPRLRMVVDDIAEQIAGGSTITEAMAPHRAVLGDVYVETVRAAEVSGNLIDVLARLAEMLDRQYETSKRVKGALMYPICVISALVLAVTFLMIFVVPKFAGMFAARGVDLPITTQLLIFISDAIRLYWYLFIGAAFGAGWAIRRAWSVERTRRKLDTWLHRVPVLRSILQGLAISRFAHVFGISLKSGVRLIDALEMAGRASGRPMLESDSVKMCEQVNQGGRLSDVLVTCAYLPPFTRRMLAAGEEASEMWKMCEIIARHYDREVEYLTKNIATVVEPIMIAGLAAVVLIIALAIFLPLWNMAAIVG